MPRSAAWLIIAPCEHPRFVLAGALALLALPASSQTAWLLQYVGKPAVAAMADARWPPLLDAATVMTFEARFSPTTYRYDLGPTPAPATLPDNFRAATAGAAAELDHPYVVLSACAAAGCDQCGIFWADTLTGTAIAVILHRRLGVRDNIGVLIAPQPDPQPALLIASVSPNWPLEPRWPVYMAGPTGAQLAAGFLNTIEAWSAAHQSPPNPDPALCRPARARRHPAARGLGRRHFRGECEAAITHAHLRDLRQVFVSLDIDRW